MDNLFPLATANWKAGVRLPHRQNAANSALMHGKYTIITIGTAIASAKA
jgi:hypothetical protein